MLHLGDAGIMMNDDLKMDFGESGKRNAQWLSTHHCCTHTVLQHNSVNLIAFYIEVTLLSSVMEFYLNNYQSITQTILDFITYIVQ